MVTSNALRPAWTPLTIILMVLGFIVFWPLGLLMLAYILWGDRIPEIRRHFEGLKESPAGAAREHNYEFFRDMGGSTASGNAAFDDYRAQELRRLDEERQQLDKERKEFESFVRDLRHARDREEFDRFMQRRSRQNPETGADL